MHGNIIDREYNKEELKNLKIKEKICYKKEKYTNEILINYLIKFYEKNKRVPVEIDFVGNPEYPGNSIYWRRFGSWSKALKLAGLDINTKKEKYTDSELLWFLEQFYEKNKRVPVVADFVNSIGHPSYATSSGLVRGSFWGFHTLNKYKKEIDYYYFGAFNENYTKLIHVWRVPTHIIEKDYFIVGLNRRYEYNVENMKEFEIIDRFNEKFEE